MDSSSRASLHALPAESALIEVNICHVVLYRDSLELTFLLALAATNAGCLTSFHGYGTFVLIHTADEDAAALRTLLAQFYDMARTSLDAGTT